MIERKNYIDHLKNNYVYNLFSRILRLYVYEWMDIVFSNLNF